MIRNSRRPDVEGTSIICEAPSSSNAIKSIVCKTDLTLLAIRPPSPGFACDDTTNIEEICRRNRVSYETMTRVNGTMYLAIKNSERYEHVQMALDGCVEVRMRPKAALITLVGQGIARETGLAKRVIAALTPIDAQVVGEDEARLAILIAVPQAQLSESVRLLHATFFEQVDATMFCAYQHETAPTMARDRRKAPAVMPVAQPGLVLRRV